MADAQPLGLGRAAPSLADLMLPAMVAAMTFLAAMALGGAMAAQSWADRWRSDAGTTLTAQVPRPGDPADPDTPSGRSRLERCLDILRDSPAVADLRILSSEELTQLLRPWLGGADPLPLGGLPPDLVPAVIAVRARPDSPSRPGQLAAVAEALRLAIPGATLEDHAVWLGRLDSLLIGLRAVAAGALVVVALVAALVTVAATRAGLVARRATLDVLHGLGATDGYVAGQFARQMTVLTGSGGCVGLAFAVPVLVGLARLAEPFLRPPGADLGMAGGGLPTPLWLGLAVLPLAAAAIGYVTAQATARLWLRVLP